MKFKGRSAFGAVTAPRGRDLRRAGRSHGNMTGAGPVLGYTVPVPEPSPRPARSHPSGARRPRGGRARFLLVVLTLAVGLRSRCSGRWVGSRDTRASAVRRGRAADGRVPLGPPRPRVLRRAEPRAPLPRAVAVLHLLDGGDVLRAARCRSRSAVGALVGAATNTALAAALGATLLVTAASFIHRTRIVRRDVAIAALPAAFDGYRIVQLSDLHCGPFASGRRVARWVAGRQSARGRSRGRHGRPHRERLDVRAGRRARARRAARPRRRLRLHGQPRLLHRGRVDGDGAHRQRPRRAAQPGRRHRARRRAPLRRGRRRHLDGARRSRRDARASGPRACPPCCSPTIRRSSRARPRAASSSRSRATRTAASSACRSSRGAGTSRAS